MFQLISFSLNVIISSHFP